METTAGYRELEHTADWALEFWAPNFTELLEQAARGMYSLAGAQGQDEEGSARSFCLRAADLETLLVGFLSELLYYQEQDGLIFDAFSLSLDGDTLQADLLGVPLARLDKEIKAVTYHNLQIHHTGRGIEARIVFDV